MKKKETRRKKIYILRLFRFIIIKIKAVYKKWVKYE